MTNLQWVKELNTFFKDLIAMAKDGHKLNVSNGVHREFLSENMAVLSCAAAFQNKYLSESPPPALPIKEEEKTVGQILKEARQNKGLTTGKVLYETGVSEEYLRKLEADELKAPSASVLWKLTQFYQLDMKYILTKAGVIVKKPESPSPALPIKEEETGAYKAVPTGVPGEITYIKSRLTVRIKSAPPGSWYENLVGEYVEVYGGGSSWVVAEDYDRGYNSEWRHIEKNDAFLVDASPAPIEQEKKEYVDPRMPLVDNARAVHSNIPVPTGPNIKPAPAEPAKEEGEVPEEVLEFIEVTINEWPIRTSSEEFIARQTAIALYHKCRQAGHSLDKDMLYYSEQNNALQHDLGEVYKKYCDLTSENTALQADLSAARKRVEWLEKFSNYQSGVIDDRWKDIDLMTENEAALEKQIEALQRERDELEKDCDHHCDLEEMYRRKCTGLEREREELRAKVKELQEWHDSHL